MEERTLPKEGRRGLKLVLEEASTSPKVLERQRPCWTKASERDDLKAKGLVLEVPTATPLGEEELELLRREEEDLLELLEGEEVELGWLEEEVERLIRLGEEEEAERRVLAIEEEGRSFLGAEEVLVLETGEEESSLASLGRER